MRIGIDYTSALNQRAGIGRFTRGMVYGLSQVDRTNQYVLIHARTRRASPENALPGNFVCRQLPLGERALAILWHRLGVPASVEYFAGQLDIFHAPDYVLPPLRQAKGIITVHDLSVMLYPEHAEPNLVKYLCKTVPGCIERARLILADSNSTRDDIIRLLGAPENKVQVVYGGVDRRFAKVADPLILRQIRESYPIDRPYIFSLGTIEPRKNLVTLLEAYDSLRATGKTAHRLLIGGARGWQNSRLARAYDRLTSKEDVIFLGFIPDEDLPALYS
ncbi:MAG: glycosyltransferase family 1 protein, partial [Dehalococcoidia bacterium]|nr:glycosyltransferase family 1 protein [Dehalococcoidia bacterium]